jgi:hypothetical protein
MTRREFTRELAEAIREESERTKDEPYPAGTEFPRPNVGRSKPFTVRLSASESAAVQRVANRAHLPASTMVRAWILDRLDDELEAEREHDTTSTAS